MYIISCIYKAYIYGWVSGAIASAMPLEVCCLSITTNARSMVLKQYSSNRIIIIIVTYLDDDDYY